MIIAHYSTGRATLLYGFWLILEGYLVYTLLRPNDFVAERPIFHVLLGFGAAGGLLFVWKALECFHSIIFRSGAAIGIHAGRLETPSGTTITKDITAVSHTTSTRHGSWIEMTLSSGRKKRFGTHLLRETPDIVLARIRDALSVPE